MMVHYHLGLNSASREAGLCKAPSCHFLAKEAHSDLDSVVWSGGELGSILPQEEAHRVLDSVARPGGEHLS